MRFIPKIVSRLRGDYVEPKEYNDTNRLLYSDMRDLFEKELALTAKTRILASMIDSTNSGVMRVYREEDLPSININTAFIYPEDGVRCIVDSFYGEITVGVADTRNVTVNSLGKMNDGIVVERTSDSFIFSQMPRSVSETRIKDVLEDSEFPYIVRVKGVTEDISLKINISTTFGHIEANTIEFVPFPMAGGTELRNVEIIDNEGNLINIDDPTGTEIDLSGTDPSIYYYPMRLISDTRLMQRIQLGFNSSLYVPNQSATIAGLTQIKVIRNLYEPVSYIGFKILPEEGKLLTSITPVSKWHNTFIGSMEISVYDNLTAMQQGASTYLTKFSETGVGLPVQMDKTLYAMVKISTEGNTSPQLTGFEYESTDI